MGYAVNPLGRTEPKDKNGAIRTPWRMNMHCAYVVDVWIYIDMHCA